jgi:hypothetical protein
MITIEKAKHNIGFPIVYLNIVKEYGIIYRVTDQYIFVTFDGDIPEHSKACCPRNITLQKDLDRLSRWEKIVNET